MPLKLNILLRLAALLALVVIVVVATGPAARAQVPDDSLPRTADLSITAAPDTGFGRPWTVSVKANTVGGHRLAAVRNVKVRFSAETVSPGSQVSGISPKVTIERSEVHGYSDGASTWTIFALPLDGSAAEATVTPPTLPGSVQHDEVVLIRVTAEIVESDPAEPRGFQGNNAVEFWYSRGNFTNGDAGVNIHSISDRSPGVGQTTTFTVRAENHGFDFAHRFQSSYFSNHQLGVQVKIELSPGLTFAGTPSAPSGTNFNAATGIWDIGTLEDGQSNAKSLPVAVNLTAGNLADLPLEERCLTARVVNAVPWFKDDLPKRQNDITTACLGEAPKFSPLTRDEFILFNIVDCVGIASQPCTSENTVEILARAESTTVRDPEMLEREITRGLGFGHSHNLLKPERITVQVRDPAGRVYDNLPSSLTDGSTVSWNTGRENRHTVSGVAVKFRWSGFNDQIGDWMSFVPIVTVSGLNSAAAPGRVRVGRDNSTGTTLFDPNPTYRFRSLTLGSASNAVFDLFLEFTKLGTYLVEFKVEATRTDSTVYPGSGTYTFHVGPMAELEVRDVGADPAVAAGRRAYTVMAVNNGPDGAPAVRVTGLPTGVTEFTATRGEYDPASGVWTIGRLGAGASDGYRNFAHAYEGPTLTLVTDDPAAPDITATIENTQDYTVVIDGTTHSTAYYDHIDGNNTATIAARAGTGAGHPDAPAGVTVMETSIANILVWSG